MVPINYSRKIEQTLGVSVAPIFQWHQPHGREDRLHVDVIKHVLVRDPQHQLLNNVANCNWVIIAAAAAAVAVVAAAAVVAELGLGVTLVICPAKLLGQASAAATQVTVDNPSLALVLLALLLPPDFQGNHILKRGDVEDNCHGGGWKVAAAAGAREKEYDGVENSCSGLEKAEAGAGVGLGSLGSLGGLGLSMMECLQVAAWYLYSSVC